MNVVVVCPNCSKRYTANENLAGNQVSCSSCGNSFQAQPVEGTSADATTNKTTAAASPAAPTTHFGKRQASPPAASKPAPASPVAGPSDRQFRIGAVALIPIVLLGMTAAFLGMNDQSLASIFVLLLGPLGVFFSVAAIVDPNIVRAAGKFGSHLSMRYKLIAAVIAAAALAVGGLLVLAVLWR